MSKLDRNDLILELKRQLREELRQRNYYGSKELDDGLFFILPNASFDGEYWELNSEFCKLEEEYCDYSDLPYEGEEE